MITDINDIYFTIWNFNPLPPAMRHRKVAGAANLPIGGTIVNVSEIFLSASSTDHYHTDRTCPNDPTARTGGLAWIRQGHAPTRGRPQTRPSRQMSADAQRGQRRDTTPRHSFQLRANNGNWTSTIRRSCTYGVLHGGSPWFDITKTHAPARSSASETEQHSGN